MYFMLLALWIVIKYKTLKFEVATLFLVLYMYNEYLYEAIRVLVTYIYSYCACS